MVTVGAGISQRGRLSWWESRALYGWRVLIPQTKDPAEGMLDLLRMHGAIPQRVPTVAVEPPRTPAQMERAVKGLVDGRYQWVVFTSTNSVRALWEKFTEFGLDARAFSGVRIACVDSATGDAVRALGHHPGADLARTSSPRPGCWRRSPTTTTCWTRSTGCCCRAPTSPPRRWPRGCGSAAGRSTTSRPTARCVPRRRRRRSGRRSRPAGFDAVCFTSSSTVRNLVGIAGKPHSRSIVACLGPKTAETAREFGLRVDVQPEVAEIGALIEALAEHATRLRAEGALPPPRKSPRRR